MAHWDSETGKIIHWPTRRSKQFPKWDEEDCGCSGGLEWGGEYPRECRRCKGGAIIYRHRKSGVTAQWPGGPFT